MNTKASTKISLQHNDLTALAYICYDLNQYQGLMYLAHDLQPNFSKREYDILILDLMLFINRLPYDSYICDIKILMSFIKSVTILQSKFTVSMFPEWKLIFDVLKRSKNTLIDMTAGYYEACESQN